MRIPVFAFITLFILSVIIDFFIYKDILRHERKRKLTGRIYAVSSAVLICFLAVIFFLPRRDADSSVVPQMWMLYSYMTIYASKFIYLIFAWIGRLINYLAKSRVNFSLYLALPVALLCFCILWWGSLVTIREIEVNEVTIASSKLPESFNNYKIVQFSDAHVGTWGNDTTFISNLVNKINSLHPDVIFFTGDIVNRMSTELEPFVNVLSRLHARDGVYSILGNHDYGDYIEWKNDSLKADNLKQLKEMQLNMGWKMLNNSHSYLVNGSDSIAVIGVENWGEPPFSQYGKLGKAYPLSPDSVHNVNDAGFKILLTHNPMHWSEEVTKITNIDLTLSGHTHAMQFMLSAFGKRWSPSVFKYKQWGGLYSQSGKNGDPLYIYVNIGAGEVGMPMRIGAVPELTVITLSRDGKTGEK